MVSSGGSGLGAGEAARRFGTNLRRWRRHNGVKQAVLAEMLGVSQPAVARWEGGYDLPSPQRFERLRDLMAKAQKDEALVDRLFIGRQSAVRALVDYDGMRLLVTSAGFQRIWPESSVLIGIPMADVLVNEANRLFHDPGLSRSILDGTLGLLSGVSTRHLALELDSEVPHRWHACFRRRGGQTLVDVVYEPGGGDLVTGIDDAVYIDDAMSGVL